MEFFATRCVDELGRIVLPIELRRRAGIRERSLFDIFYDKETARVILLPSRPADACAFCGETDHLTEILGRLICGTCMEHIAQAAFAGVGGKP